MALLSFQFTAQRYHATPWGSHVNEGLVEWPPSPWRILRALIHTGFAKEGWAEIPPTMKRIIERLSGSLPQYQLPDATAAHSRHYMPAPEKTTKVIDAFAWVGTHPLLVNWPCELVEEDRAFLASLLSRMSYLGRAESWVHAQLLPDGEIENFQANAFPADGTDPCDPGWEQTSLLTPVEAGSYHVWREGALSTAEEKLQRDSNAAGKKVTKKALVQLGQVYPVDLTACLTVETGWLQSQGWSQPPGSRRALYWRRSDSLEPMRSQVSTKPRRSVAGGAHVALLALSTDNPKSQVLPRLKDMLPVAERLHRALIFLANKCPDSIDCEELSGKDSEGKPLQGHRHAKIIPLCLNTTDSKVNHFLLHTHPDMPLGDAAHWALHRIRTIGSIDKSEGSGEAKKLFASLVGLGKSADFTKAVGNPLGVGSVWASLTPFVPPRHLKERRHGLVDQVQAELTSRGFPEAVDIEVFPKEALIGAGFLDFKFRRARGKPQPPSQSLFGLTLRFAEPFTGPLTLGYGSHFGLGLFGVKN